MKILAIIPALALALAGCAKGGPPASVAEGECKLVRAPEYAVRGKTDYDQRWVNRTTEAIVVGCKQPRPKARPAEFDAQKKVISPFAPAPTVAPAKKRHWWQRKPSA